MKFKSSKINLLLGLMLLSFFLSGTLGNNANATPAEVGEIAADNLDLSLWVNDDDYYVNQGFDIYYDIYNNANYTIYANVTLRIDSAVVIPLETNRMIYNSSSLFNMYYHSFSDSGIHNITLQVSSTIGYYTENIDVEIIDYVEDIFVLDVYQDNYAMPGEEVWMDLEVESHFNYSMYIDLLVYANWYVNGTFQDSYQIYDYYSYWIEADSIGYFYINHTFTNEGYYDIQFVITDDMSTSWSETCWWDIYYPAEEKFELYIDQDNYAMPGEEVWMGLEVVSSFNHGMFIDVEVIAEYYADNGTYIDDFSIYTYYDYWIGSQSNSYFNIYYTFYDEGYYDLTFIVIDDIYTSWYEYCYWDIYYETEGYFDLWVEQECTVREDENAHMDFFIDSFFDVFVEVDIKVTATFYDGYDDQLIVIYEAPNVYVEANNTTVIPIDYVFDFPNHYELEFEVAKQPEGDYWYTYSHWDVIGADDHFFKVWIEQDHFVEFGYVTYAYIHVESFFEHNMYVDLVMDLIYYNTGGEQIRYRIFENFSLYIMAGEHYVFEVLISAPDPGYCDVEAILFDDEDAQWFGHCWYEFYIPGDGWLIHIDQRYEAQVYENANMWLKVKNLYNETKFVNLFILIEEWDDGFLVDNYSIWEEYDVSFFAQEDLSFNVDHQFENPGHYEVIFILEEIDTRERFYEYCWWDIYDGEPGRIELWVDQDFYVDVDTEAYMGLHLKSRVDYDMPIMIDVKAKLMDGGTVIEERTIYHNSEYWLAPFTESVVDIYYTFDRKGHWELEFEVQDDNYDHWYTYCHWDVGEYVPESPIKLKCDIPDQILVDTVFDGDAVVINNHNVSVEIYSVRIILEPVELELFAEYNISYWFNPGDSEAFYFSFNATDLGNFKIRVEANTSIGFYDEWFSFRIVDEIITDTDTDTDSDTDSDTDTAIQFSPGFEYFLLPLVAVALTFYKKKK